MSHRYQFLSFFLVQNIGFRVSCQLRSCYDTELCPQPSFYLSFWESLPQSPRLALKPFHHPWTCEVSEFVTLVLQPSRCWELQLAPLELALDWSLKQLNWDRKEKNGMHIGRRSGKKVGLTRSDSTRGLEPAHPSHGWCSLSDEPLQAGLGDLSLAFSSP